MTLIDNQLRCDGLPNGLRCRNTLALEGPRAELQILEEGVDRNFDFCPECLSSLQIPPGTQFDLVVVARYEEATS